MKILFSLRKFLSKVLLSPGLWIYWIVISFLLFLDYSLISVFLLVFLFVLLFNFLPFYLIKQIECKYHVPQQGLNVQNSHILVLGGGHIPDSDVLFEQQLNNGSLRRVLEGVRLFNLNSNSLLVMSGESLKSGHPSQAEIQAKVAVTMGIKIEDIKVIPEPYNTENEALFYFRNFSFHDRPIFLVTKALHLKRAVFIFSSFGYKIIPSPAYFIYKNFQPNLSWFLAPDFSLILHFGEYLKELVGFFFFKMKINLGLKSFPFSDKNIDFRKSSFDLLNR